MKQTQRGERTKNIHRSIKQSPQDYNHAKQELFSFNNERAKASTTCVPYQLFYFSDNIPILQSKTCGGNNILSTQLVRSSSTS